MASINWVPGAADLGLAIGSTGVVADSDGPTRTGMSIGCSERLVKPLSETQAPNWQRRLHAFLHAAAGQPHG